MPQCPVCNDDVDNVDEHAMKRAQEGDQPHKETVEKMQKMKGHEGHSH